MNAQPEPRTGLRAALSKERLLRSAVGIADDRGIDALTMRALALDLGVEAMSLYHYLRNKDELLDGIVEVVINEINEASGSVSTLGGDWKDGLRRRILASRSVLLRHSWAPGVIGTRTVLSPALLLYYESLLGLMRAGGFSYDLAHHALHALGSRALGFSQELFQPAGAVQGDQDANPILEQMVTRLPHLVGMITAISHDDPDSTLGWCDDQAEFEFGLDLILDGLDRVRAAG